MSNKPKPGEDFTSFADVYLNIASKSANENYQGLVERIKANPDAFYELCNTNQVVREIVWMQLDDSFTLRGNQAFPAFLTLKNRNGWPSDGLVGELEKGMKTGKHLYAIMLDALMGEADSPLAKMMRERTARSASQKSEEVPDLDQYINYAYDKLRTYFPKKQDSKMTNAERKVLLDLFKTGFENDIRFLLVLPETTYPIEEIRRKMVDVYSSRPEVARSKAMGKFAHRVQRVEKRKDKLKPEYYNELRSGIEEERYAYLFKELSDETFGVQIPLLRQVLEPYVEGLLQGTIRQPQAVAASAEPKPEEKLPAAVISSAVEQKPDLERLVDSKKLLFSLKGRKLAVEVGLRLLEGLEQPYVRVFS